MNLINAGLQTIATALVGVGAAMLVGKFSWDGVILVLLGLLVYVVYELFPTKAADPVQPQAPPDQPTQ